MLKKRQKRITKHSNCESLTSLGTCPGGVLYVWLCATWCCARVREPRGSRSVPLPDVDPLLLLTRPLLTPLWWSRWCTLLSSAPWEEPVGLPAWDEPIEELEEKPFL